VWVLKSYRTNQFGGIFGGTLKNEEKCAVSQAIELFL
jgi:hypothetical protein